MCRRTLSFLSQKTQALLKFPVTLLWKNYDH